MQSQAHTSSSPTPSPLPPPAAASDFSHLLPPRTHPTSSPLPLPPVDDDEDGAATTTTTTTTTSSQDEPAMAAAAAMAMPPPSVSTHSSSPEEQQRQELPRPYKCPLCDKAFHRLEHQTRHIRTHTGEKPHACQFPGCTKRFSRSDELTRHSRIHNNPNSRRGKQAHHAAAAAMVNGVLPEGQVAGAMGPPAYGSFSGPNSSMASPNVSPPYTYSSHPSQYSSPYGSYGSAGGSPENYSRHHAPHGSNMNLLATAASHVARESDMSSYASPPVSRHPSQSYGSHSYPRHHPYDRSSTSNTRGAGLAAYHYSPQQHHSAQPMSRSHSHEEDDQYSHRMTKRSRPGSPYSTNPPSPTFSNGSYSPTPGHTPAMTPAHSPRIRAKHGHFDKDNQLPGIRSLSLQQHIHSPALEPLEPSTEASGGHPNGQVYTPYSRSQNNSSSGLRITDIINREEGAQRKLPVPLAPGLEMEPQTLPSLSHSGASSAAGSVTNSSEWLERR